MLTTRIVYISIIGVNLILNGLALLHVGGFYRTNDDLVIAALVFNLIAVPVALFGAYRIGEMVEDARFSKALDAARLELEEQEAKDKTDAAGKADAAGKVAGSPPNKPGDGATRTE